jgi:hypothetical protein
MDRATKQRSMNYIGQQVIFNEQLSTACSLSLAGSRETNIYPASEEILGIPLAFAMA